VIRLVSWNVGHHQPWDELDGYDVALLQELRTPTNPNKLELIPAAPADWRTAGYAARDFRTAIARRSDDISLREIATTDIHQEAAGSLMVSRPGTITAAEVRRADEYLFTAISVYAPWDRPAVDSSWIYADASAHRLISDLSALIGSQQGHKLVVAGDFNLLRGYGEEGNAYWAARYATVFARFHAIGVAFVGPSRAEGIRDFAAPEEERPADSETVPTYYSSHQRPETARRQLDFVFASASIADKIKVRARNGLDEWGPSDHCRVEIEVDL